ncbi:MAG: AIPR family protein [Verrucomicrobiales bacterium]
MKTINGIRALQARRFNEFSETFRDRSDELELALDTPGVKIHLALAFLGLIVGPHVTNDLDALKRDLNRISERMNWEPSGLDVIHGWLIEEQGLSPVGIDLTLENWQCTPSPKMTIYGQISIADLAELVGSHGTALFQRNIRHYLGSIGVNAAISRTALRNPQDFFYLNNGLTAVAQDIQQAGGDNERCVFHLTNVSIVNGAQTAGAVASASISGEISIDAKVLITIIKIGADDDLGLKITKARNHQTAVRGVDFAALDPNQERIRRELASAGITYHYRPSEAARVRTESSLTLEDSALALACLSIPLLTATEIRQQSVLNRPSYNAIEFVVTAKKSVARLWEQNGSHYKRLFTATTSGLSIFRQVQIFRFIDRILHGSEWSEHSYYRRMFFRHGRYFIMAFVAQEAAEIVRRPELHISAADQTELSRITNELSELIFSTTEPLHSVKGYLSIFRNLTDSQPLADNVLARLSARNTTAIRPHS